MTAGIGFVQGATMKTKDFSDDDDNDGDKDADGDTKMNIAPARGTRPHSPIPENFGQVEEEEARLGYATHEHGYSRFGRSGKKKNK